MRSWTRTLTRSEWLRLSGFGGVVALLHVLGWGLFVWYSRSNPALAGLGTLAYTFGLRHAFDADHIAAIDNTTRKMLQNGKRPLGVGFFFSLGHSTIVFTLAAALAVAAKTVNAQIPTFQHWGGYVGAGVSGPSSGSSASSTSPSCSTSSGSTTTPSAAASTGSGSRRACSTVAS